MRYLLILVLLSVQHLYAKQTLTKSRLNKLAGESKSDMELWDTHYNGGQYIYGKRPAKFLVENFSYLKEGSQILDLGMGEGRNAVFLAQKGHVVTGIDISANAIDKAKKLAGEKKVRIKTIRGSATEYDFLQAQFDVIICFHYVDRSLNKKILSWLKPGGIIIYEAKVESDLFEKADNYYLKSGELLTMFPGTKVLKFEEPVHDQKFRSSAILKKKGFI